MHLAFLGEEYQIAILFLLEVIGQRLVLRLEWDSLQPAQLYLISVQLDQRSRAFWVLAGLCVEGEQLYFLAGLFMAVLLFLFDEIGVAGRTHGMLHKASSSLYNLHIDNLIDNLP